MRTTGNGVEAGALAMHDHVSWSFDDPSSFVAAATSFLAEGARLGERVGYIGGVGLDHMREALDEMAAASRLEGSTFVTDLGAMYQGGTPDPEEQVEIYMAATHAAVADGFCGLRVAADATGMATHAASALTFARYEHLVDRAMVGMPFTAMCGYDVTVVGEHARTLACLHPATNDAASTFGVFAAGPGSVGLRGELDARNVEALAEALELADWPSSTRETLDLSRLGFIDHRALHLLHRRLEGADASVQLRGDSAVVGELVRLLDLHRIDAGAGR